MLISVFLLLVGFALLIKGADFLVLGGASLGKIFGMSDIAVGLTIVAFGTSAPELVVSVFASIKGTADIAIGNVIGSNIANILLALGVGGLITPLKVSGSTIRKEIPYSLLSLFVIFLLANDALIDKSSYSIITRSDGLVLILFFVIFINYSLGMKKISDTQCNIMGQKYGFWASSVMILGGLFGIVLGGELVVDEAVYLASAFGMSQTLIGLTIVALGTSLPEIATSSVAAYRGKSDIAIGNAVGSNIFNLLLVLGIAAAIKPLPYNTDINMDILVCVAATCLLLAFVMVRSHTISRVKALFLFLFYCLYIALICIRG